MTYDIATNNIHIYNSCFVSKREFGNVLDEIEQKIAYKCLDCVVFKERSKLSCKLEWASHNFLYNLNIARNRTHDVDLDAPQKWYYKVGYAILGCIGWIFIE